MKYQLLSDIGAGYLAEEGTSGERNGYLTMMETKLKQNLAAAKTFASSTGPNADVTVTWNEKRKDFGAKPATVAVGGSATKTVKELAALHTNAQQNTTVGERLNAEVVRMRQWLFRQGATLTPDGSIVWPKSNRVVEYDHDIDRRGLTQLSYNGGRLMLAGKPFDTRAMVTAFNGPGYGIYVMSDEGNIHVSSHAVGNRHHSSLLAGEDVAAAGEMSVTDGRLKYLSNKSGHYTPDVMRLLQALAELDDNGVPLQFQVQLHTAIGKTLYDSVDAFMRANGFDNASFEALRADDMSSSSGYLDLSDSNVYAKVYGGAMDAGGYASPALSTSAYQTPSLTASGYGTPASGFVYTGRR